VSSNRKTTRWLAHSTPQLPPRRLIRNPLLGGASHSIHTPAVATESSPQIQQRLETIASNLAIVRALVYQLTVSQKRMAQDIATADAAKENFSHRRA
jgi:hypothetical protein